MQKIVLMIAFSLMIAMGGCKTCGNHDVEAKRFSLQIEKEEKELFLSNKSKPSIQIGVSLTPGPETDKDIRFKVSSINGLKGKLLGEQGEEISLGSEIKRGDNIFSYMPDKTGDHDLRIEVSDEKGDIKQNARVRLHVKEKTARFKMEVKELGGKKLLLPYQEGNLHLELSAIDDEASKLEYIIKSLSVTRGNLFIKGGEELKEGAKLEFKGHDLLFVPSGELGMASIKLNLENEEGYSSSASTILEIKAVEFDLNTSMYLVEGKDEQAQVSIHIPTTGNDLDKEVFQVVGVAFSDRVERKLINAEGNDLTHAKLRTGARYAFYLPVEKLGEEVGMKVKLLGAGGVYEKDINFSAIHQQALVRRGRETLEAAEKNLQKGQAILSMRVEEKSYENVSASREELEKDIAEIAVKIAKLEASGLDKHLLDALKRAGQELAREKDKVAAHFKKINDKKFAFQARLELDKPETFKHMALPLRLTLAASEPLTRRLGYKIKDIVTTKGKIHGEKKTELIAGEKVNFGDNNLVFVPSGEIGEAKVKLVIENEQGAEDMVETIIHVKPVDFKVHVGSFDTKGSREGYGKLDVSIETDKLLEKDSFKVVSWKFKQDDRDKSIEDRVGLEDFKIFKENMCLLVAGGREEKKIEAALKNLEAEKEKREEEKNKATENLNDFLSEAQTYQRKLEGYSAEVKRLEDKLEAEKSSSGALSIATKYDVMEKVKGLEDQSKEAGTRKVQLEKAAFVLQEQINRDKDIFEKEDKKAEEEKRILEGKKKVWEEMKKVRDKKFNEELQAELLSERLEKKESHPLSGEHATRLYVKLVHASMPSILVLKVEGPGGVAKEVEVNIREGVDERLSDKASLVIKNLTELGKVMDQKLKGNENGEKYHELTRYLDGLELDIKVALTPLRESYGEDWWTNPSFMELKNSRELTEVVLKTMDKLRKLEEMQSKSKNKLHSFDLDIIFDLPKGGRVWAEDYLEMKIGLKDVDPLMKKKVWKVMSWKCDDDAVILAGEKGKVLSEVILSPDRENKLHIKFPSISLGYKPKFLVKVGCFDGEELIMHREIGASLGSWVQLLFEENVGKFIERVKEMNKRIEACFGSKAPIDHRFDTLANMEIEAHLLKAKHEKTQGEVGGSIKNVAFLLSEEIKKKVVEYADQDIPRLEKNIKLLGEKKEMSKIKNGTVEELENIDTPNKDNGNLLMHKLAGEASISAKDFEAVVKATKELDAKNQDGRTAMHVLASSSLGDSEKVKRMEVLLKAGANINTEESKGNTPLHIAAARCGKEVAEFLLRNGAFVNAQTPRGLSPLLQAVYSDNKEVARVLLNGGANIELKDKSGDNPLNHALFKKDQEMVALLLNRGGTSSLGQEMAQIFLANGGNWNAKDKDGRTPLHIALDKKNFKIAALLIAQKVDVNAKNERQETPLHLAAREGKVDIIQKLLAAGADVAARNRWQENALYHAYRNEDIEVVKILLHAGISLDITDKDILLEAVNNSSIQFVEQLLNIKRIASRLNIVVWADKFFGTPSYQVRGSSWTPLHVAASSCDEKRAGIISVLLKYGADKEKTCSFYNYDSQRWNSFTPVELASWSGHSAQEEALK